jgi:hypothetical protein
MLSSLLVPMIITQDRTTRFDSTRVQALDAAQAGIDVTLGLIRASTTSGIGDSAKLPCGTLQSDPSGGPDRLAVSGVVNSTGAAAYFTVVEYFTSAPGSEPYPSAKAMRCLPGYGTYDPATGTTAPAYARFTSTGTVGAAVNGSTAGRTLTSTYAFRYSNVGLMGGPIALFPNGAASLCMDVGSPTAPAGTAVQLQACSTTTPPAPQQVFAYRPDLTLQLLSSITAATPQGLCLRAAHTPAVSRDTIVLSACGPLGSPAPYTQQWSFNDSGKYQAAQSDSSTTGNLPDLCMTVAGQTAGQPVILSDCGSAAGWVPSPSIGPGAAASSQRGANAAQWVNYKEFGRCIDVTNQDPNIPYLIDYPCKQNPYPGAVRWNQLFSSPAIPTNQSSVIGQIITNNTDNGQSYCLTSPGTNGGRVTIKTCSGSSLQSWTIYNGDKSLSYSAKYTVVNGSLCLGLSSTFTDGGPWSVLDVETCNGSTQQKWNADPTVLTSTSTNIYEK